MKWEYNILALVAAPAWKLDGVTRDGDRFIFAAGGVLAVEIDVYSWLLGAEAVRLSFETTADVHVDLSFDGELNSVFSTLVTGDAGGGEAIIATGGKTAKTAKLKLTAPNGAVVRGLALEHALGNAETRSIVENELPVLFMAEAVDKLTIAQAPAAILQLPLGVTRESVADVTYTITGTATSAATLTTTLYLDDAIIRPRATAVLAAGPNTVTASALLTVKPGVHVLKLLASVTAGTLTVEQGDAIMIGHGRYIKTAGLGAMPQAAVQTVVGLPSAVITAEDVTARLVDVITISAGDVLDYSLIAG